MFGGCSSLGILTNEEKQSYIINNSYFTQSYEEQCQLDIFIRSSKLVKIVETVAEDFIKNNQLSERPENNFSAIIVKLPFAYSDFLKHSLNLLHFLIEEPVQFANAVKYCVFSLVRKIIKDSSVAAENNKITNIDIDQIHILIRFMGLPLQQDLCFEPYINLYRTGLTEVIGFLSALSEPEKVVIQSVWYCATGCTRNKIKSLSLDVPNCTNCRHPMNEYSKLRQTQNFRLLRILPAESIESPHQLNKIFRSLTVRVLDHVFDCKLELGNRYLIIGHYNYISQKQEFEAWNLTII
ncbi:uncharacterized protein LOC111678928 [Lucilia cuprina]|uniref:uncharacterized protein LOC111678928 n=1 Tax=Lucilia cuprina TaxID=7375 RepID=UPI001F054833|nr:uncharacterized protein LOC111678928 [Lucilia cuprina]